MLPYLFGLFIVRFERRMLCSKFSPGISPSVWICIASSSVFVWIGTIDVSYVVIPIVSGISSSSSSSSSSSVSQSDLFRFRTLLNFPFNMSRRISSQRPYFPSSPRRQCLFFGCVSPLVFGAGSRLVLNFRLTIFPISVFTVFPVPLTAVCIFFWNFSSKDFLLRLFSRNLKG